jgi:AcrR family transcriptional regulator
MPKIDHDTKEKILAAAEKVFHANGFKGTRTTKIAEEAGISRTMLHYYYSTKEALFQEVLDKTLGQLLAHLKRVLSADGKNLVALISHLIDVVDGIFEEKPGLPTFLVNILNETPEMAHFLAASQDDTIPKLLDQLLNEARAKHEVTTDMNGEDLILNIYSLCSFPYLTTAYIKAKEKRNDAEMKAFLQLRRENIKTFVLRGLR